MKKHIFTHKILTITIIAIFIATFISSLSFAQTERTVTLYDKSKGLQTELALDIHVTEDVVWFSSDKAGATSFEKDSGTFKFYTAATKFNFVTGGVGSMTTAFGKRWFGTADGLNEVSEDGEIIMHKEIEVPFIGKKGKTRQAPLRGAKHVWFKGGKLWVCSHKALGGLYFYDGTSWTELRFVKSVFNYVNDIEIVGDNIWFATATFGIYIYDPAADPNAPPTATVKPWKSITSSKKSVAQIKSNVINDMLLVGDTIWAATTKGIAEISIDGDDYSVTTHDKESTDGAINNNVITALTATADGDIIAGSMNGIFIYSNGSWDKLNLVDQEGKELSIRKIYSLAIDGDYVWIGSNLGILRME